jgi:hypothetical protein
MLDNDAVAAGGFGRTSLSVKLDPKLKLLSPRLLEAHVVDDLPN